MGLHDRRVELLVLPVLVGGEEQPLADLLVAEHREALVGDLGSQLGQEVGLLGAHDRDHVALPVLELAAYVEPLPGLAAARAEEAVVEQKRSDTGLGKAATEEIDVHLLYRTDAVRHRDCGYTCAGSRSLREEEPGYAQVVGALERHVALFDRHRPLHRRRCPWCDWAKINPGCCLKIVASSVQDFRK